MGSKVDKLLQDRSALSNHRDPLSPIIKNQMEMMKNKLFYPLPQDFKI